MAPRQRRRGAEGGGAGALNVQGLPLIKPPYGRITAFDMNKGESVWQIAHGETPDNIRIIPALRGVTIPRTGGPAASACSSRRRCVVAGEGGLHHDAERPARRDAARV